MSDNDKEAKSSDKKKGRKISNEYQKPEFINIAISDPKTYDDDAGKPQYTDYLISVNVCRQLCCLTSIQTTFPEYSSQNFTVRRRYREFVWLKDHLRQKMEEKGKRLTIAELPGNTFSSWLGTGKASRSVSYHQVVMTRSLLKKGE